MTGSRILERRVSGAGIVGLLVVARGDVQLAEQATDVHATRRQEDLLAVGGDRDVETAPDLGSAGEAHEIGGQELLLACLGLDLLVPVAVELHAALLHPHTGVMLGQLNEKRVKSPFMGSPHVTKKMVGPRPRRR